MSLIYAESKIKEALKAAKGNKAKANQIIMTMAQQDMKLLAGLTKHHLKGVTAYHVDRVLSGRTSAPQRDSAPKPKNLVKPVPGQEQFGLEILKSIAGNQGEVFGFDSGRPQGRRGQASQNHINALKQMAERARHKK